MIRTLSVMSRRTSPRGRAALPELPEQLGDLHLLGAETLDVRGVGIDAHRYRDPAGHEVVIYRSHRAFPMAAGARRDGSVWEASADGTVLFRADRPVPSLLAGDDLAEVRLAARLLGLS